MPQATGLVAEMTEAFPDETIESELIQGSKGIFVVKIDGEQFFSKHEVERFPMYREIPDRLKEKRAKL